MRRLPLALAVLAITLGGAPRLTAQSTPEALADTVLARLAQGDLEALRAVFPFSTELKEQALAWGIPIDTDSPVVLRRSGDEALILLGAWPRVGNRGDETILGRVFSGVYRARRGDDGWHLAEAIPVDAGNRIHGHRLQVELDPAAGLRVRDTLAVAIADDHGLGLRLNRAARILDVRLDGAPVRYAFAGGYLWVDAPRRDRVELVVDYHLDVATDTVGNPNSGRFGPDYGHVRSQYFWHPFFDFDSDADRAEFDITVRAPAGVHVVTDLPQRDTVDGDRRVVRARSARPTYAVTLIYDAGLEPIAAEFAGGATTRLYLTPGSEPAPDTILAAIRWAFELLTDRFGAPRSRYLAVAQTRLRQGAGWQFRSNDLIAAGAQVGLIDRAGPLPQAWLGHEVAHGWTSPTGPALNFLSEGWASFAESVLLRERYGAETEADFWEAHRAAYETRGFDGTATLVNDPFNSGIAYHKGSWVLRMLRDHVGEEAFRRGMATYMALPPGEPAGIEEFVREFSRAAGRDIGPFLEPWVFGSRIPDLDARIEDGRVVVEQRQDPVFLLGLDVDLVTDRGTVRRTLRLDGPAASLSTAGLGPVRDVALDPEHRLLIRRHRGERVTFRLVAPDALEVKLEANFLAEPRAATRADDGAWVVEIPLTAGTYGYGWLVDGERREPEGGGRLVVQPLVRLGDDALPGARSVDG